MGFPHASAAMAIAISPAVGLAFGLAVAAANVSCAGSAPAGASCNQSSDCENGLACLYSLGSGCEVAKGQCLVPTSDCSGGGPGVVVCDCASIPVTCIPSSDALPVRTVTGPACATDATDATDGGAGDGDAGSPAADVSH
ncbi:MAG TPA: hypothetical protein VH044_13185 [Polyangiaceae bacterium]|nr:hypothetical protein [Polyangiaceae bacterium]